MGRLATFTDWTVAECTLDAGAEHNSLESLVSLKNRGAGMQKVCFIVKQFRAMIGALDGR
jgi:hypothetical protein